MTCETGLGALPASRPVGRTVALIPRSLGGVG
jgi:hypothetical protein